MYAAAESVHLIVLVHIGVDVDMSAEYGLQGLVCEAELLEVYMLYVCCQGALKSFAAVQGIDAHVAVEELASCGGGSYDALVVDVGISIDNTQAVALQHVVGIEVLRLQSGIVSLAEHVVAALQACLPLALLDVGSKGIVGTLDVGIEGGGEGGDVYHSCGALVEKRLEESGVCHLGVAVHRGAELR